MIDVQAKYRSGILEIVEVRTDRGPGEEVKLEHLPDQDEVH